MNVKCNVSHKTCLEKGRTEEAGLRDSKGKEEGGRKQKRMEGNLFVLREARSQEVSSSHNDGCPGQWWGEGLPCSKPDCKLVMACNVVVRRAAFGRHTAVAVVNNACYIVVTVAECILIQLGRTPWSKAAVGQGRVKGKGYVVGSRKTSLCPLAVWLA